MVQRGHTNHPFLGVTAMYLMSRSSAVRPRLHSAAGILLIALLAAVPASAQDGKSVAAAKELAAALDAVKLDAIAAADPAEPGTFVAAMYIPGAQLLVVSAKYSAPTLITDKLNKKDFRDIYMDLQSASVAGTRVFVQDMLADGLVAKTDGAADVFDNGPKSTTFNGEWKKQKLSEDEYMKLFAEADDKYTKMLHLLTTQARAKVGSGS